MRAGVHLNTPLARRNGTTSDAILPLSAAQLAELAPRWWEMTNAIARCERIDEVKDLGDKAAAIKIYFAQSRDTANETAAARVRLRAERRLGELIITEQEAGRPASQRNGRPAEVSSVRTLPDHGIPRNRSGRNGADAGEAL